MVEYPFYEYLMQLLSSSLAEIQPATSTQYPVPSSAQLHRRLYILDIQLQVPVPPELIHLD